MEKETFVKKSLFLFSLERVINRLLPIVRYWSKWTATVQKFFSNIEI